MQSGIASDDVTARLQAAAGRLLGNSWQRRLDEVLDEDSEVCCPVSLLVFVHPVIASDGFLYERESLKRLLEERMVSPMTRTPFEQQFFPAKQKRSEAMA